MAGFFVCRTHADRHYEEAQPTKQSGTAAFYAPWIASLRSQ
jgi:hypothetical protein